MKKIILLLISILCLTGCENKLLLNKKEIIKNVEKIEYKDKLLFTDLTYLTSEEAKNTFGFDTKYFSEFIIALPKSSATASMYMVLKVKNQKLTEAKNAVASFDEKYIETFNLYIPTEASLIKNKLQTIKGDYIIYIVSHNNKEVLKTILNSK